MAEVALAFTLLVGAGHLGRSYQKLWTEDRGFPTEGLAVMSVAPDLSRHEPGAARWEAQSVFTRELRERLQGLTGVRVTAVNQVPLAGSTSSTSYDIELADGTRAEDVNVVVTVALPDYLDVMGIPLLEGRGLEEQDVEGGQAVVVVNRSLAETYWPDGSAIGRTIGDDEDGWQTVVGVVGDVRHQSLTESPEPKMYVPAAQSRRGTNHWVLRAEDAAGALARARAVVTELSPTTPVRSELILEERIAESVALPRFRTLFVVGLAGLATMLALLGVYGVVAFSVSQRTREVALRMALGARQGEVVTATLMSGLKLCGGGLVLGLAIAVGSSRILESFLYDLPTIDPVTYLGVTLVVAAIGVAAGYLPARRASRVDPMKVLRTE